MKKMAYSESFYGGSFTPFDPQYTNPMLPNTYFRDIGTSQDARTADQVKETSKHLNTGLKVFEVAAHSPQVFEAMPDSQLEELRRLQKLTGSEATIHAPMIDPTGITQHGFDKLNKEAAERQLWSAIERSHKISPKGNITVTMHASTAELPQPTSRIKEKDNNGYGYDSGTIKAQIYIDSLGGQLIQPKEREKYFTENPSELGKPVKFDAEKEVKELNDKQWNDTMQNIAYSLDFAKYRGDDETAGLRELADKEVPKDHPELKQLYEAAKQLKKQEGHKLIYLQQSYDKMKELFNLAWKGSNEEDKKKLRGFVESVSPYVTDFRETEKDPEKIKKFADVLGEGVSTFKSITPNMFVPLEKFAREKSADTISNLALKSYMKFKDTAPIISIENHPAGQSLLTTGEDIAQVVKLARKAFEDKAVKEGISRGEARKQGEKLIGATWDVGHINMLRRFGYDDKDIIEETKKVAPFVKHVHLSDNFGFEHTELPMGMGNVPIKEIMERLGKEGFKGKKVVEALSWWQHFSNQGANHAIIPTLQGFNSSIYGMQNAPYWNTAIGMQGAYQGMPMAYMPEKHFQTYGTGFSALPQDLGGQIPGTSGRFAGTPNA